MSVQEDAVEKIKDILREATPEVRDRIFYWLRKGDCDLLHPGGVARCELARGHGGEHCSFDNTREGLTW